MTGPQPFSLYVPDSELANLQEHLQRTRWISELPHADWNYGASVPAMQNLCAYWRDGFNWREDDPDGERRSHSRTAHEGASGSCWIDSSHKRG
jgi:hypothetical protein